MYHARFVKSICFVDKYHKNLINGFKRFQDMENSKSLHAPTHGFLPSWKIAKLFMRRYTWLHSTMLDTLIVGRGHLVAECGFSPGDDAELKAAGIRFFFTDAHGVLHGHPRPKYGVFAPVYTKSGVAAFARDIESSKSVWSRGRVSWRFSLS